MDKVELSSLPAIKVAQASSETINGARETSASLPVCLLSAGSQAVDRLQYTTEQLPVFLSNKLGLSESAFQRRGSKFGRWINRLTGEEGDYIDLSGVHLTQVLGRLRIAVPEGVGSDGNYLLRRDLVVKCLAEMKK